MRFSTVHSFFGSQATSLRLLTPGLNHTRHPGGGRDPDPEKVAQRSDDGYLFGLASGLPASGRKFILSGSKGRDDDSDLISPAIVSPIEGALSADSVRIASATLLQGWATRLYFLRGVVPLPLTPQSRRIAPLQPDYSRCRTCRLCRPRGSIRSAHGAGIAPRTARSYLASMPHCRAANPRTP